MTSYDDYRQYFMQFKPRELYANCPEYANIPQEFRKYFDVHDDLWTGQKTINFNDQTIAVKYTDSYSSVRLPNKNGKKFLWITQNMSKSTTATYQIQDAFRKGSLLRYTWVVDDTAGWQYVGLVIDHIYPKKTLPQKNTYDFELFNKDYQNIIYSNHRVNEFDKDFFEKPIRVERI